MTQSIAYQQPSDQNTKYPADKALRVSVSAAQPATVERRAAGEHAHRQSTLGRRRQMLAAALYYARRGWAVFPLHTPIFDAGGKCVGCTCETYRTSAECKAHHPHLYLGPDGKCENPGKCPRVRWREKSTTDEKQIQAWWGQQWAWDGQIPNIGIDCGKSGLLVFDADSYKDGAGDLSDLLTLAEQETVTVRTGGGGQHLIYDAGGKDYGNNVGELPHGFDVRGAGGYIVGVPSPHKSGNEYFYEESYGPREMALAPIPAALDLILTEAHQKAVASAPAHFTAITTDKPVLKRWRLSQRITETINQAAPVGQRSEADMSVCVALVYAGATDDQILSVFEHYPVGTEGKYAERGRLYLAHTIGRARAHVAAHPRPDALIEAAKEYFLTADFTQHVSDEHKTKRYNKEGEFTGYKCAWRGTVRYMAGRVLDIMASVGRVENVVLNAYQIIRPTNSDGEQIQRFDRNTVKTSLNRLAWFFDAEPTDKPNTWRVSLSANLQKVAVSRFPVTPTTSDLSNSDDSGNLLTSTFDHWKADDPYDRGSSRVVRDRLRGEVKAEAATQRAGGELVTDDDMTESYRAKLATLAPGLNTEAILVIHTLREAGAAGATADEIAESHGMTPSTVGAILRKLRGVGVSYNQRRYKEPSLHFADPDAFTWIAAHKAQFRTYQAGVKRLDRALESAQRRADQVATAKETPAEHRNAANRRAGKAANKRFATLRTLHPDWTDKEIARFVYAATPEKTGGRGKVQPYAAQGRAIIPSDTKVTIGTNGRLKSEIGDGEVFIPPTGDLAYAIRYLMRERAGADLGPAAAAEFLQAVDRLGAGKKIDVAQDHTEAITILQRLQIVESSPVAIEWGMS